MELSHANLHVDIHTNNEYTICDILKFSMQCL